MLKQTLVFFILCIALLPLVYIIISTKNIRSDSPKYVPKLKNPSVLATYSTRNDTFTLKYDICLEKNKKIQQVLQNRISEKRVKYPLLPPSSRNSRIVGEDPPIRIHFSEFATWASMHFWKRFPGVHNVSCPISCQFIRKPPKQSDSDIVAYYWYSDPRSLQPHQMSALFAVEPEFAQFPRDTDDCNSQNLEKLSEYLNIWDALVTFSKYSEVEINHSKYLFGQDIRTEIDNYETKIYSIFGMGEKFHQKRRIPLWKSNKQKHNDTFGSTWISNCKPNPRSDYLTELSKLIPLHHYGSCGFGQESIKDADQETSGDRYSYKIQKQNGYPFVFAFENHLLDDYVTEKYFHGLASPYSVMVYMGRLDGSQKYEKYIPVEGDWKIFINVQDYKSPQDLAAYLKYLLNNQTAYEEYFDWRRKGTLKKSFWQDNILSSFHNLDNWLCGLCEHYHKYYDKKK